MIETAAIDLVASLLANGVTPEMILNPKMEDIVDADGHKRFIEGNVTPANIIGENDIQYAKWSLSGSHLMIVLAIITSQFFLFCPAQSRCRGPSSR